MTDKQKKQVSDKVPKGMLKSTKELPVKNGARKRPPVDNKKPRNVQKQQPPRANRPAAQKPAVPRVQKPAAPRVQKPVDPRAQKAVARAMSAKTAPKKRRRFRGGNYILYYILAAVVVVIVMLVLANTVLFKCGEIEVLGNARYSASEIIGRSGLKTGDNLLHINVEEAEESIVGSLAYIDKAEVKRSFPTKLVITVDEAEKWYALSQGSVTAVVSRMGKIIELGNTDGLTVVKGFDAESVETGAWLKSKTDGKDEIPRLVLDAAEKEGLEKLDEIDMTDKFSIKLSVDGGRVVLELGPATEIESKLRVAAAYIKNELGAGESVTVLLTNPEKFAVRNKPKPEETVSSSSTTTSAVSEEPGTEEPPETDGDGEKPLEDAEEPEE
ncbi:MAG: FtsQ-type POTRA domain-containing protein [Lachnospiraceae bacterium]|nr:FtsQ-type POTRA domain-containing protein [Ruminococcus sp.]MCM1275936.1 FtsQ-type POTRA domain-containing protein [Lachnospiraceae bacterium]